MSDGLRTRQGLPPDPIGYLAYMARQVLLLVAAILCFLVALVIALGGAAAVLGAGWIVWALGGLIALAAHFLP